MHHEIIAQLTENIMAGNLPASQPQDIDAAVRLIVDKLPDMPVEKIRTAMKVLNDQRLFDHARTIGQASQRARPFDASVTKHCAQAQSESIYYRASARRWPADFTI
jgi:hypothetical protein